MDHPRKITFSGALARNRCFFDSFVVSNERNVQQVTRSTNNNTFRFDYPCNFPRTRREDSFEIPRSRNRHELRESFLESAENISLEVYIRLFVDKMLRYKRGVLKL